MSILDLLKKKYMLIMWNARLLEKFGRKEQEKILSKYNNPRDLIERSYFQYKVKYEMRGKERWLFQAVSIFLIIYKLFFTNKKVSSKQQCDLFCFLPGMDRDMVPDELRDKYKSVGYYYYDGKESFSSFNFFERECLFSDDRKWFFENIVKRYPFDFFFQFRILSQICRYSYVKRTFKPKAIANFYEYSANSSALTKYCHDNCMKHINIMHGEKGWYIGYSFFQFDECYIWHEHYKKMFVSLKAEPNQFIIAIPPKFLDNKSKTSSGLLPTVDFCYYFANETKEQIDSIIASMSSIKKKNKSCRIRLHPRCYNHEYINKIAEKNQIEIEKQGLDINDSILSTKHAIAIYSTVLFQSYLLGISVVIDDITSPEVFRKLEEVDYIVLSFPHLLLSEVIESL